MNSLLVAGTDTDVGKTVVVLSLAAYYHRYDRRELGLIKLLQTGEGDRGRYQALLGSEVEIPSVCSFAPPLAPPLAAAKAGQTVDLKPVWETLIACQRRKELVLVEGLGGLGSPVTWELTVADLARDWALPTLLVVPVKLGSLGQAIANVALARQAGVNLVGIVLNCLSGAAAAQIEDLTPPAWLETLTNTPVIGVLPYLENLDCRERLAQAASQLALERLAPVWQEHWKSSVV